jgi:hypothetical protein
MKRATLVGGVLAVVALVTNAGAYPLYTTGTQVRGTTFKWRYSGLGSDGQPWSNATLTPADVRGAVYASFQDFTAGAPKDRNGAACSVLELIELVPDAGSLDPDGGTDDAGSDDAGTGSDAGVTVLTGTTARVDDGDGVNAQGVFISSRNDPLYPYVQGGVVAFASPVPDSQGYVTDCDTAYNAVDTPFALNGSPNAIDLMGVAQQETAHCFGLHHVCRQSGAENLPRCSSAGVDMTSVMFPFAGGGPAPQHPNKRDQDNMCQLYPVNGIGRPCDKRNPQTGEGFTVADCQQGTACGCTSVGAICTLRCGADAGGASCPTGSTCDSTGQCIADFNPGTLTASSQVRSIWTCGKPPGASYVGASCDDDDDCGGGMTCLPSGAGGYCSINCAATGCPSGTACLRGVVSANDAYCVQLCSITQGTCNAAACRPGLACQYIGAGRTGICWSGCTSDADCDSSPNPVLRCQLSNGLCYRSTQAPLCMGPTTRSCAQASCAAGSVCDAVSGNCLKRIPDAGVTPVDAGANEDAGTDPAKDAGSTIDGGDPSVVDPPQMPGCGCNGTADGAWLALGVLVLAAASKRRAAIRVRVIARRLPR